MRKLFITLLVLCPVLITCFIAGTFAPYSDMGEKNFREEKAEALAALQFMNMSRAYPNADIPPRAFADAYNFYTSHFTANPNTRTAGSNSSWSSIGPDNVGGRSSGIAIDPNDTSIIWIGAASGGLWKSTTGGYGTSAWTYIPTGYPVRGVSAIAVNPSNSNEIMIGTGETYNYGTSLNGIVERPTRGSNGIGILKSTDGGLTWSMSLNWIYNQERGVWDIVYNPKNPKVIYAATTEGIFKSTDGGISWNLSLNKLMVMDIVISTADTSVLLAGVGNLNSLDKGIYKTTNSGNLWTLITSGLPAYTNQGRITLNMYPPNNNIVMAEIADIYSTVGVYRSVDGGDNWTAVDNSTDIASYQGWYAKGLLMKSDDSSRVLFGGVDLFRSTNSGSTISDITPGNLHSDIHGIVSNPYASNKVYILTDGGLYRSNDFGSSCVACRGGYVTSQFYIGAVSATDSTLALGGLQDNNTIRYHASINWSSVIGGDGTFCAIDPTNDNYQYGSYQYFNIYKATNRLGGFSQVISEPSDPNGNNPAAFVAPLVLAPNAPRNLYGGLRYLVASHDRANTWARVGPQPVDNNNYIITIGVAPTDSNTVYFGTAPTDSLTPGHVFRSNDGGNTVTDITASLPNRYPRDIEVSPTDKNEVYITYSGFGSGHIFKSLNGGTTWTDISTSLPDVPFHCITIDPSRPDTLYAGSDLGVFISADRGLSWFAFNNGLPDGALVFDIVYSPSDQSILAFTFGNGVYKAYLNTLSVGVVDKEVDLTNATVYPSPTHNTLKVDIASKAGAPVIYQIFDRNGRLVKTQEGNLIVGANTHAFDVSGFAEGIYYLNCISGDSRITRKFIVL